MTSKQPLSDRECAACGKLFHPDNHRRKYCSRSCSWQGRRAYDGQEEELDCKKCGKMLPVSEFYPHATFLRGYQYSCKECSRAERAERTKIPHDPYLTRKYKLKGYGITPEDYEVMYTRQKGCCAICGEKKEAWSPLPFTERKRFLVVDHCRKTSQVRGLLCWNCNCGIGHLKENAQIMMAAIDYVSHHESAR